MKVVVTGTRGIPNILGGVETHCEELFPRIAQKGIDITIIRRKSYVPVSYTHLDVLFRKASGYLMCSKNEAMGRVTVEALFNGCPVIGYDGGGTPEIIKDGINGFLFKTPEQCAWAMQQVLNPEISSRIIENGFDAVRDVYKRQMY